MSLVFCVTFLYSSFMSSDPYSLAQRALSELLRNRKACPINSYSELASVEKDMVNIYSVVSHRQCMQDQISKSGPSKALVKPEKKSDPTCVDSNTYSQLKKNEKIHGSPSSPPSSKRNIGRVPRCAFVNLNKENLARERLRERGKMILKSRVSPVPFK